MEEDTTFITNFKGFSGCKIHLCAKNGNYFVRKISKSQDYNSRLKQQMLKQKFFHENLSNNKISTPQVLAEGKDSQGNFFFDMEYIRGRGLIDFILEANTDQLCEISEDLQSAIYAIKKTSKQSRLNNFTNKLNQKIESIKSKISVEQHPLVDELKKLFQNLDVSQINQTFCHGDLVMDNILYDDKNKKYYFIDLLDHFIDHYWFDISTLFQDIEGQWYKFKNPAIDINNIFPKMNFINGFLRANLVNQEEIYKKYHNLFLALKFSRILPYAQPKDFPYLTGEIKKNINCFKKNN